ncbi:DNA mismatch repair endonuclease MutL [Ructibacterium gallinarum]|uniref:DNA mismatch repair protein MutL n=1 Tax=Ructibacterium gallinarum TaxID=2779355 RepID=A0A9D5LY36_9FIRM|nr:DNA mismatch repair endonuclease MutL [Ructibacterium gallinarum]MBE5040098.1 DNA mismatch repair endonuclease MutL [Ructibacterium gallinarum]
MHQIQVLDQAVADKIAAGEVAERPSAVVKELVENAIDAGADRIQVEIRKGGVEYIRVADNGCGIPAGQVETAFLRHATSKLSQIDDLYRISTMGFRGEALASICAVAEVEVITKTPEEEEGVYLRLKHGISEEKSEIACGTGTSMMVENLFANVPARMKFLKKDSTEAGYVADVLGRIALSRPKIAFSYTCDGKEIFTTTGDGKLASVILKIYGLDHAKALLPVDYTESGIHISGVVGKPELARGNRTRQTLFVNGRYVKNHVIAKVVEEAFRNNMMVGKFPFFVISVDLPAELVDVNVHPAKTEVKFANEKQLYDIAYHAVRNAIGAGEKGKREEVLAVQKTEMPKPENFVRYTDGEKIQNPHEFRDAAHASVNRTVVRQFMENTIPKRIEKEPERTMRFREESSVIPALPVQEDFTTQSEERVFGHPERELSVPEQQSMEDVLKPETTGYNVPEKNIIGQVFDTYLIYQTEDTMCLIDQHAAHERFRFEKLKKAYFAQERFSQMLLTPVIVTLEPSEKLVVMENLKYFSDFGFEIEDFGTNDVIVHASPIAADDKAISELVLELTDALQEQIKHPIANFEEKALDMISCKYAIKANHHLSLPEMQDLLSKVQSLEAQGITTCPHGRPISVRFTQTEIEKMFKRKL